jgi:hypothetical protein
LVSNYSWDEKVVLALAGFAVNYGEFWLVAQLYLTNPLAKAVALLKQLPDKVVWLPVVDRSSPWSETKQKLFEDFQRIMPWYSVHHPSLLDVAVIRYIKEVWHFNKRPLLVVLDPQGRVVNPNAIHMMWIWGSLAFPFTSLKEEALWKEETWKIELLADSIDPMILSWV